MSSDPNCIFCKIVAGQIPSRKVYEDDELFGFHDIAPWAPVHFMLVPKRHIPSMAQVTPEDSALLGRIMTLAPKPALEQGCRPYPQGGYRIVVPRLPRGRGVGVPPTLRGARWLAVQRAPSRAAGHRPPRGRRWQP